MSSFVRYSRRDSSHMRHRQTAAPTDRRAGCSRDRLLRLGTKTKCSTNLLRGHRAHFRGPGGSGVPRAALSASTKSEYFVELSPSGPVWDFTGSNELCYERIVLQKGLVIVGDIPSVGPSIVRGSRPLCASYRTALYSIIVHVSSGCPPHVRPRLITSLLRPPRPNSHMIHQTTPARFL